MYFYFQKRMTHVTNTKINMVHMDMATGMQEQRTFFYTYKYAYFLGT